MLGIKHDIFRKAQSNWWIRYWWRRTVRFERQTGLLTAGLPLTVIMVATLGLTTVILDRQFEIRDMRQRSLSAREASLEQEHEALREFLKGTEDEYEMVKIPETFRG